MLCLEGVKCSLRWSLFIYVVVDCWKISPTTTLAASCQLIYCAICTASFRTIRNITTFLLYNNRWEDIWVKEVWGCSSELAKASVLVNGQWCNCSILQVKFLYPENPFRQVVISWNSWRDCQPIQLQIANDYLSSTFICNFRVGQLSADKFAKNNLPA